MLLICAALFAQAQHADTCSLHIDGDILDNQMHKPIAFASIYILETKQTIKSNENGYFAIQDICSGSYTLIIGHDDCVADTQMVLLNLKDVHIDIFLKHEEHELSEVHITETRKEDKLLYVANKLNMQQLQATAGDNLWQTLQKINGVRNLQTGTGISKPIISGLHSNRVLILYDGVPQEGQQWGAEHAPEIDVHAASTIIVEKGVAAIQYGHDALGGVVLIKPATFKNEAGLRGSFTGAIQSVNARISGSLALEGQFSKTPNWNWRIQGSYIQAGNTCTPKYYLKNTAFREGDFSFFTSYFKNKWKINLSYKYYNLHAGIFSGSHIGNVSDLLYAYQADVPRDTGRFSYRIATPNQQIQHHTANIEFQKFINEKHHLHLRGSFQFNKREEYDKVLGRSSGVPVATYFLYTSHANAEWVYRSKNKRYVAISGATFLHQINYFGGMYFIPEYQKLNGGIYSIHTLYWKKWSLQAAVRGDLSRLHITQIKRSNINETQQWVGAAAGITLAYKPETHSHIGLSLGSSWRPPHAVELYSDGIHHGAAAIEIGNKNLNAERAYMSSIDFSYDEGEKYNVNISVYNKYIQNFIYLKPTAKAQITIRGAFPVFNYEATQALFSGFDIAYQILLGKGFSASQKISMVYARNLSEKNYLPGIPPFINENQITYTIPIHKRIDNWQVSLRATYTAKQFLTENTQELVPAPKGYCLLDFESAMSIQKTRNKTEAIRLFFGINNMLNTQYRNYMNRWRFFADEAGINVYIKIHIPVSNYKTN